VSASASAAPAQIGLVPHDRIAAMGGLAFLKALFAGELPAPPFSATSDIHGVEAEAGRVVFVGRPSTAFYNPLGTIHGGWTSMIMDSALGCAVLSVLEPGQAFTTIEIKVNLVRPLTADTGEVRCEGTIVHQGGRILTSEARLTDARGRLLAHGTSTCMAIALGGRPG
jgi:uncharacterized protein (TIGR00369 family)